ncbi:hypothetical protein V6D52_03765 [Idiomarina loihiensis]|uniref:hypothetical protein n=1 Tax=Idiomarina loihiensis TaxID=135577 RepID=UPI0039BDB488
MMVPEVQFKAASEFSPYAIILADQISELYKRSTNGDGLVYTLKPQRLDKCVLSLRRLMNEIWSRIPNKLKQAITDKGLGCFDDKNNRALFEFHAWAASEIVSVRVPAISAIPDLLSMHFNKEVKPYSVLQFNNDVTVGCTHAFQLGFERFSELRSMLYLYIERKAESGGHTTEAAIKIALHRPIRVIIKMFDSATFSQSKHNENDLKTVFKDKDFTLSLAKRVEGESVNLGNFHRFLQTLLPEVYGAGQDITGRRRQKSLERILNTTVANSLKLNVLESQLSNLYERSSDGGDGKPYTLRMKRFQASARSLMSIIPKTLTALPTNIQRDFFNVGLDCLQDETKRALFEFHAWTESQSNEYNAPIRLDQAVTNLLSMHLDAHIVPSSHLLLPDGKSIDIARAYQLGYERFTELLCLLKPFIVKKSEVDNDITEHSIRTSVSKIVNMILTMMSSVEFQKSNYSDAQLTEVLKNKSLILTLRDKLSNSHQHQFNHFLRVSFPDIYGESRTISLRTEGTMQEFLNSISPAFADEVKSYLSASPPSQSSLQSAYSSKSNKLSFIKYLYDKGNAAEPIIALLRGKGIAGLAENSGEGFKKLEQLIGPNDDANKKPLSIAISMYNHLHQADEPVRLKYFSPHTLVFNNPNDGTSSTVSLSFIYNQFPTLFKNINEYHEVNKIRTDGDARQSVSVKSDIYNISVMMNKVHRSLTEQHNQRLAQFGFNAFAMDKNALLKHVRLEVQRLTNQSKISPEYGKAMQYSLNNLLKFFGLDIIRSYQINSRKYSEQKQREQKNKVYSFEQVVQIAFAIEKSLMREDLTPFQMLCLMAARILLKTGWNLTPLLELECNDIFYLDTSISGNKTAAVRLFKRRADYQTHWYDFKVPAEALQDVVTGTAVSAVMRDIEYIRDMTNGLASQLANEKHHNRIFVHTFRGRAKLISTGSFSACINRFLKLEDLDISFNSRKIRKQGMNFTYRKVKRNFKDYKKASQHTPYSFYRHYFHQDHKEASDTISDATSVMADYFLRDVTDRVIIVRERPENAKRTPNGSCIQTKNSDVTPISQAQTRKTLTKTTAPCADFSACLFCKNYRCVADAEHTWRLLSYQETVVGGMQSASTSFSDDSLQTSYIAGIKARVKEVLSDMREVNPEGVAHGEDIFQEKGVHPDWALSSTA